MPKIANVLLFAITLDCIKPIEVSFKLIDYRLNNHLRQNDVPKISNVEIFPSFLCYCCFFKITRNKTLICF